MKESLTTDEQALRARISDTGWEYARTYPDKYHRRIPYDGLDIASAHMDGLETVRAEIDRRKGDPVTRLHNVCEALHEQTDESPFTREEWERVDKQTAVLQRIAKAAREFVDNFPSTYVDDGNCRKEWRELNEALTAGDAT